MGGPAALDQLQGLVELGLGVVGQRQHDVAADVLKPRLPRHGKGGPGLFGRVGAAQGAQLGVPGGLHPEGDAVHPRRPEARKALGGDGLGVRFQGDLGPGQRRGSVEEPLCLRRSEQAGRAAAEIDRIRPQGRAWRKAGKLPQQGVHIGVRHAALAGAGVEIAVAAFGETIGDVQVKPQGHTKSQPFS